MLSRKSAEAADTRANFDAMQKCELGHDPVTERLKFRAIFWEILPQHEPLNDEKPFWSHIRVV